MPCRAVPCCALFSSLVYKRAGAVLCCAVLLFPCAARCALCDMMRGGLLQEESENLLRSEFERMRVSVEEMVTQKSHQFGRAQVRVSLQNG
eukprot:COSAG06_NODE_7815_length_2364_cov_4.494040_1_plen_91_part_00